MGRPQRLQARSAPRIMAGGTRSPWGQAHAPATVCQPVAPFGERLMPSEHGATTGFAPTPPREARRRGRREEAVTPCRPRQAPSDSQHPRQGGSRIHLLDGSGPHGPPVVAFSDSIIAPYKRLPSLASPLEEKSCGFIEPLERGLNE